jgi:hypothetical protein
MTFALAELDGKVLDLENMKGKDRRNQTITQFLKLLRQHKGCTFSLVI